MAQTLRPLYLIVAAAFYKTLEKTTWPSYRSLSNDVKQKEIIE